MSKNPIPEPTAPTGTGENERAAARTSDGAPTAAVVTPAGRGAVATIAVQCSPELFDVEPCLFMAANRRSVREQPIDRICFGRWGAAETEAEDVVLCRTGEQTTEIHCHGGSAAANRILRDLAQRGCRAEAWETQLAARGATTAAIEVTQALSRAATLRTAGILLEQQTVLVEELRNLPQADPDQLPERLDNLLRWSEFGVKLTEPWRVVLCGRPNVGKSSLINALLGYTRSIVFDQPGTTRDLLTANAAFDGWPVELTDTAGLRDGGDVIETIGVERARERLKCANLAIIVIDRSRVPTDEDYRLLEAFPDSLRVANKCDLEDAWGGKLPSDAMAVSSLIGDGVEELASEIGRRIAPTVPDAGTPLPVTDRQMRLLQAARKAIEQQDAPAARSAIERCLDDPGEP
ncbi:MAG: GTP-binding protein [Planctomycetota bacterium]|nr:MAG: GTP-binding protein [Planctomycetota bacterium]REK28929.1 MAG: GTP-binding protein [Planctomycetota bacterium]REK39637.1 MAG: GTP-binding protein [Planctomycetota bacterium]